MTGGRYSGVNLDLILVGPDSGRSLLTGGRYSEVAVNTGLTVHENLSDGSCYGGDHKCKLG
jgi:hypothetical protein